jgi:hypothetical protein
VGEGVGVREMGQNGPLGEKGKRARGGLRPVRGVRVLKVSYSPFYFKTVLKNQIETRPNQDKFCFWKFWF